MSAAILAAAENKGLSGMAAQMVMARKINGMLGTSLAPWELEDLPDEWLTALEMWIYDMPRVQDWRGKVNESLARLRNRNQQVH